MSGAHSHAPHVGSAAAEHRRPLAIVLGLSLAYLVAAAFGGLLTGSLALLADAGHVLVDVLGLAMALLAIQFARRPATPARTYGFYRAEILAALANGLVLFAVAGYILFEAWRRFGQPPEVDSLPMLAVAVAGLLVNLVGVKLLHQGAGHSLNTRGAYLEVLADLLASVGVVAAALVIHFTGWWQADPLVSVLIGLFILPRTWGLVRSALDVLLEATPAGLDLAEIERAARALPGVRDVHDLHAWSITSGFVAMSAHVEAEGRRSAEVLHDVQAMLRRRFGIEHATLQVESADHADDGACCTVDPRCLVVGDPARRPLEAAGVGPPAGDGV